MESTEERKTAWTPGPWEMHGYHVFKGGEEGNANICSVSDPHADTLVGYYAISLQTPMESALEAVANAHLIAAAPLLREVAELAYAYTERIRLFLDAPERGGYELERFAHELQDKACAALAAARGEAS